MGEVVKWLGEGPRGEKMEAHLLEIATKLQTTYLDAQRNKVPAVDQVK